MIGRPIIHSWRDPRRLVDAAVVAVHEMQRNVVSVILSFFENALVSRVNRRIDIRIVVFCRST
jgi:hypothetical protein